MTSALLGAGCSRQEETAELFPVSMEDQQRMDEYKEWQESKAAEDVGYVEKQLKERWKDEDQRYADLGPGLKVGSISSLEYEGRTITTTYTHETRRRALQGFIALAKTQEEKDKIIAMDEAHPDWHAINVYNAANNSITENMIDEAVELAYGKPDKKLVRSDYTIWWYWTGKDSYEKTRDLLVFNANERLLFFELDR